MTTHRRPSDEADLPSLEVKGLTKRFAGTVALDDVSLSFRRGAVTALLGPNGCGKSTLIKVLAGFHTPEAGEVLLDGHALSLPVSPQLAYRDGLRFIHQDLGLIDGMSITDNFGFARAFDGRGTILPLNARRQRQIAAAALAQFGVDLDPDRSVGDLGRTDQIMVSIARAFAAHEFEHPGVVVLDEPTASLPAEAVERVLSAVELMRSNGGTVIYVTHRIDEVLRIADDVAILRDGRVAAQHAREGLTAGGLAELIMGSVVPIDMSRHVRPAVSDVVLTAKELTGPRLRDVGFEVRRGEIVGIAGLAGCGRSELARMLGGVQQLVSGVIEVSGQRVVLKNPRQALDAGIAYVPSERTRLGLIGDLPARINVTLGDLKPYWRRGFLQQAKERRDVGELFDRFNIRPRDIEKLLRLFSGGNQQKAVLATRARLNPRVLVIDEPTQGVDVLGKQEIAAVIRSLATDGCAIVIASSDFDEIAELCDSVIVLDRGHVLGVFAGGTITERDIAIMASSQDKEGA